MHAASGPAARSADVMHRAPPALDKAQRVAALGRVPREVYDVLSRSPTPLKAYDLLWRLQAERGRRAPPSTVYRAANLLIEAGLVHRIDPMAAYVACTQPDHPHTPAFLVCEKCGAATEIDATTTQTRVETMLVRKGFAARAVSFTLRGVCAACSRDPASA